MTSLIKNTVESLLEEERNAALVKLVKHLEDNLEVKLVRVPSVEVFSNSKEAGAGIRYVFDGTMKSLRFNWPSEKDVGNLDSMTSVDIWDGTSRNPNKNIKTKDGESFMNVLPHLVKAIDPVEHVSEARKGEFTPDQALTDFFKRLRMGKTFTRGDFIQFYHNENVDIFDTLVNRFSNQITLTGKRVAAKRGTNWEELKKNVLGAASNMLNVEDGGEDEEFADWEEGEGHVSFSDSLKHLHDLTSGVAKGSFNALFVGGKGGTGKTQTVEAALKQAGLSDGSGYVKVTGSASASGIYSLLFEHHDEVILFDDSDGALEDVDARNLIKAATDTKQKRKLAWQKSGSVSTKSGFKVPPHFNFMGRIIFVSNLSLDKLDPDGSIRTRAFIIIINPTNDEMIKYMAEILPHIHVHGNITMAQRKKVLSVVKEVGRTNDVNLRTLVRALNLSASGVGNWEDLVKRYA